MRVNELHDSSNNDALHKVIKFFTLMLGFLHFSENLLAHPINQAYKFFYELLIRYPFVVVSKTHLKCLFSDCKAKYMYPIPFRLIAAVNVLLKKSLFRDRFQKPLNLINESNKREHPKI